VEELPCDIGAPGMGGREDNVVRGGVGHLQRSAHAAQRLIPGSRLFWIVKTNCCKIK